jgi:pimeloyl-ACP methyl ester carboxylesterase
MHKITKAKTTSLGILLVAAFMLSALAGIGKVHAIASTEYTGTLDGADWRLLIPDPWNGMLVVLCRGYVGPTSIFLPTLNSPGTVISSTGALEQGFAVAASSYGAAGFSLLKGVNSTYQLTNYIIDTYNVTGKVFLVGLSMGGSVALLLGEKYPEVYSGVLDVYGGKDWKDVYAKEKEWASLNDDDLAAELTALGIPVPPPGFGTLQALRSFYAMATADIELATGGTPETVPQAYEDCSPAYHANITIPVITVHGTADPLIPYYQSSTMYQTAVANAGRSNLYRLYNVTGAGHTTEEILLLETGIRFNELVEWSNELTGSLTLTPAIQKPEASVTVHGTGFGATNAVSIGFGTEVNVINETLPQQTGPYDVGNGPYITYLSHVPIKSGTFRRAINISTTFFALDADAGNGTLTCPWPQFVNGTINYVTGQLTLHRNEPLSSSTYFVHLANYTYYQYDVTPAAGVTTNSSGAFTTSITVPNVPNGVYTVTAVDTQGHIATATLSVDNTIPEGLTIEAMVIVSSIAMIVGTRYFRKRAVARSAQLKRE